MLQFKGDINLSYSELNTSCKQIFYFFDKIYNRFFIHKKNSLNVLLHLYLQVVYTVYSVYYTLYNIQCILYYTPVECILQFFL